MLPIPPSHDAPDTTPPPRPSRGKRLVRSILLPHVSGKGSALWLICCFGVAALLIPTVLGLPLWIEFEIVVAVWWLIWAGVLTGLLYQGHWVSDDYEEKTPPDAKKDKKSDTRSSWWPDLSPGPVFVDSEGCLVLLGIGLAIVILIGLFWFLIEIAIPFLLVTLYLVTRGMLAQVINRHHGCRGSLLQAALVGVFWATVYTAPIAGVVWLVHYAQARL